MEKEVKSEVFLWQGGGARSLKTEECSKPGGWMMGLNCEKTKGTAWQSHGKRKNG